ncbi:MAG: hypothetical protein ABR606_14380 [Vicinamibacterales bacterium]
MTSGRFVLVSVGMFCLIGPLMAANAAWKWSGSFGDKAVEMLIIGDIQVHSRRADPTTAFGRVRETLKRADRASLVGPGDAGQPQ